MLVDIMHELKFNIHIILSYKMCTIYIISIELRDKTVNQQQF